MRRIGIWGCWLGLASCACGSSDDASIDRHVEPRLSISQGVYGQTTSQDDVGDNPVQYAPMMISVFSPDRAGNELATVQSDAVGFYQLPLALGAYAVCTSFKRCQDFQVSAGQCVRLDYEFSVGPGWSPATVTPCPQ